MYFPRVPYYYGSVFALICWTFALNVMIRCLPITDSAQYYHQMSDMCDWTGSGSLETDSDRVVVPVYVRCSHGTIKWYYPKGGLRVVLRHGTANKDFRGCIRIARNSSSTVRMYVEGHQQLHKLYAFDDGKHSDLLRCFVSINGKIAIFIESEPSVNNDLDRNIVKFSYDLQSVSSTQELLHENEECRPCDDSEMLSLFCSSDFIIEGTIHSLFHNKQLERSELTIRAHNIIKDPIDNTYITIGNNNTNSESIDTVISHYGIVRYFTLYRPLKCGTKAGSGTQFLFFGKWILDNPVISCAPKLSHWKHVKSKAIESATNQCQLA